jgi:1-acyl-sn-glycerol-3-phosphate acyltransferase
MPAHHAVARFGALLARTFYRLEIDGPAPPADGPLLVVANHPNSLLDPALVTVATRRPARFLAKAPLFTDPLVGWLVRASGAIPVHRRQDAAPDDAAPARVAANDDTFRAAEGALLAGDAIALFPEGISHAHPALAPLRTGAARLALGTAARRGRAFPIVPVGITLDDRAIFRSRGLLVVGAAVAWDDLAAAAVAEAAAGRDPAEPGAVRALTARIDAALRGVTASFASWEDARVVALAEQVHAAAAAAAALGLDGAALPSGQPTAPGAAQPLGAERLARRRLGAELLARARVADGGDAATSDSATSDSVTSDAATGDAGSARAEAERLAADMRAHSRLLAALGLAPADLAVPTDVGTAAGWAARRLHLVALGALAALGTALGWVPYRVTGRLAPAVPGADSVDVVATAKALVGAIAFTAWTLLLVAAAGAAAGWPGALLALVAVPPLLALALVAGEGWRDAWRDARRFLTLRRRAGHVAELRARQAALARRVEALVARLEALA